MITLPDACADPNLFGPWFRDPATWRAWFTFLRALFGLPIPADDLALFQKCTGRKVPPTDRATEAWLVCGRRAGKSFVLALIATYLAAFWEWRQFLSPGERGTVAVIASDRKQARVIFRYLEAFFEQVPMLATLVKASTKESIELTNGIVIEVHTASYRTIRGYTVVAALCDEIAFWRLDESAANPDTEILSALRPSMATIPGAMLLCASSPYARRGALWEAYRRHHGKDGKVLVWQADTATMNPTVPASVIAEAYENDPASAAAEYGALFRTDVETFVSRESIEACLIPNRREFAPIRDTRYFGFCDPSGGSSDAMTLGIGHREGDRVTLDCLRERRPPFSPDAVAQDFATVLRSYSCGVVTGDRYAGEWPRERFRNHGITYLPAAKPKSDLYRDLLPLLNAGRIELLDDVRSTAQLLSLERRTTRGGKDSIDHPPGGHDDLANVIAGVASLAAQPLEQRRMLRVRPESLCVQT